MVAVNHTPLTPFYLVTGKTRLVKALLLGLEFLGA
jgi:hypothetical protein